MSHEGFQDKPLPPAVRYVGYVVIRFDATSEEADDSRWRNDVLERAEELGQAILAISDAAAGVNNPRATADIYFAPGSLPKESDDSDLIKHPYDDFFAPDVVSEFAVILDQNPNLNKTIEELCRVEGLGTTKAKRAGNAFKRAGITDVRELLAIGKEAAVALIPDVGKPTVEYMATRLATLNDPTLVWEEAQDASVLVRLYPDSADIPGAVIGFNGFLSVGELVHKSVSWIADELYYLEQYEKARRARPDASELPTGEHTEKHYNAAQAIISRAIELHRNFRPAQEAALAAYHEQNIA